MRLPLFLCVALIGVLTGCEEGSCTMNHCTISSMMDSENSSSSYQQAPVVTRYQGNPETPDAYNTPEHAKYKGIRWGGNSSNHQETPARETYREAPTHRVTPESTATNGFVVPEIVRGRCQTNGAAEYDPATNTIHICKEMGDDFYRFAIAHETGHAVDWQQDGKFEPDREYWADQYAVNRLLQEGDCEAVGAKASNSTDAQNAYTKGTYYAREMHSAHC